MKTTDEQIKVLEAKAAELQKEIEVLKTMQQTEQGMTWERAWGIVNPIWYAKHGGTITRNGIPYIGSSHMSVPTEADAKSLIAHAKLSVIAAACNQGKERGRMRHGIILSKAGLIDDNYMDHVGVIEFYDITDRDQSLITNRQLWLDFYKK